MTYLPLIGWFVLGFIGFWLAFYAEHYPHCTPVRVSHLCLSLFASIMGIFIFCAGFISIVVVRIYLYPPKWCNKIIFNFCE